MREIFSIINQKVKDASGLFDLIVKLAEYFLFEHNYDKDVQEDKPADKVVKITE